MISNDFIIGYLSKLKEEIPSLTDETAIFFDLVNEYSALIEKNELEKDSFLDSLDMFEDALDSKIVDPS